VIAFGSALNTFHDFHRFTADAARCVTRRRPAV